MYCVCFALRMSKICCCLVCCDRPRERGKMFSITNLRVTHTITVLISLFLCVFLARIDSFGTYTTHAYTAAAHRRVCVVSILSTKCINARIRWHMSLHMLTVHVYEWNGECDECVRRKRDEAKITKFEDAERDSVFFFLLNGISIETMILACR